MWRSRARSLLARLHPRSSLILSSSSQVPNPQTLLPLPPPARIPCVSLLPRFLSSGSDAGNSSIPDRTSLAQDPTPDLEKDGVFAEPVDGDENPNIDVDDAVLDASGEILGGDTSSDEIDEAKFDEAMSVLRGDGSFLESWLEKEADSALGKEPLATRVLHDPDVPLDNLMAFFTWAFKRRDLARNSPAIVGVLVEKVAGIPEIDFGRVSMVWDLVKDVGEGEKGILETKILNSVIAMFLKLQETRSAIEVYKKFDQLGCAPDSETYYLTIQALGKPSRAAMARRVYEEMISTERFPDEKKVGKIVALFCQTGNAKDAHAVYVAARESGVSPPRACLEALIGHLSRRDDTLDLAIDLLEQQERMSVKPYARVVSGLCRVKDLERAKGLLERMMGSKPKPIRAMFNEVIMAFSKSGDVDGAMELLGSMKRGVLGKPDIIAYNAVMSGFSKAGRMKEARDLFLKAKKDHRKLGRSSHQILSSGYCRIGEFDNAIRCMNELKEEGILPNFDEYKKMIQALCLRAVDWRKAQELAEEMKGEGLCLDGNIRALLDAVKELEEEEMEFLREEAEA